MAPERHVIEAPARVFHSQEEVQAAFKAQTLTGDFVAVVRFQGRRPMGCRNCTSSCRRLGVLQDRGQKVALLTDGRMSGASGKVLSAIHVTPEAARGGDIAKIRDGDIIRIDAVAGNHRGSGGDAGLGGAAARNGRPLRFSCGRGAGTVHAFRAAVGNADAGGTIFAEAFA